MEVAELEAQLVPLRNDLPLFGVHAVQRFHRSLEDFDSVALVIFSQPQRLSRSENTRGRGGQNNLQYGLMTFSGKGEDERSAATLASS